MQYRQKRNVWLLVSWNSLQEFRVTRILVTPSLMTNINLCWFQNNIMGKFLWIFSRTLIGTTVDKIPYSYNLKPINLILSFRVKTNYWFQYNSGKYFSMTQLSSHTFAHLTGSSFRLKAKLLPNKNFLGLKYNWVNSVKKWPSF